MASDFELLEAWRAGDRVAGDELVRRHFDSVYRFFRTKLDHGAEDMVQRTFLGCVEARDRFRGETRFLAFILAIARNQLLLRFRELRRGGNVFDWRQHSVEPVETSPSGWFVERDEHRVLLAALRRLPLELQIVLELHYWERLQLKEIAHIVDIPEGTVKTRLYRARQRLREQIEVVAKSKELADSTISRLDDWAAMLRRELLPRSS